MKMVSVFFLVNLNIKSNNMIISSPEQTMKEKNMLYSIQTTQHSHQLILCITIQTEIHKVIQLHSNSEIKSINNSLQIQLYSR